MNNKNYFIFAAAIALASCSVDEYMGENPEFTQTTKENIIGFGGGTGSMSRATSNEGPTNVMLDNQFKVYGWKTVSGTTQKVFDNYWVWYEGTNKTPSNPDATDGADKGWEYVGKKDYQFTLADNKTKSEELPKEQTIKYWDYSATDYRFVAGSPIESFDFITTSENDDIASATVTGFAGHITPNPTGTPISTNPVYIAKPVKIEKSNTTGNNNIYGKPVKFDFVRQQSKVRVGIYETIPGYTIKSIEFYENESTAASENKNNVILFTTADNYFVGGSTITGTVTYDWSSSANPSYTFTYDDGTAESNNQLAKATKWYGGKFENGIKATSSSPSATSSGSSTTTTDIINEFYGKDKDMDNQTGYFIVLPTPSATNASALTLKCKYILLSEDKSGEEITVTGATAAIPAAYCKWEPNKMYTYIFKISQETNGTTGTPGDPGDPGDKPGLFPITFDAAVIEETEAQQGTETIINTPSITTYQEGSVTDNGIKYITNKNVVITVANDKGELQELNQNTPISKGHIAVYKLTTEKSEAQLTATAPTDTEKISGPINIDSTNKNATFKPTAIGFYAIQYCNEATGTPAYFYKVIEVK